MVNGDADSLPGVTVDVYGNWLLLQYFTEEGGALARQIAPILFNDFFSTFHVEGILLKNRTKESGAETGFYTSELLAGVLPPPFYSVLHNGMRAEVDLVSAQNTGVFMDMRRIREKLVPYYPKCAGFSGEGNSSRLLNLFAYTSLFSVHALLHGMRSAENVDLSNVVLGRSKQNYLINSLPVTERDFVRADSISYIKQAARRKRFYDLVIIDPPTFSRYKGSSFSVQRDMDRVLSLVGEITRGYVLSAVNCHRVSIDQYRSFHPSSWTNLFIESESADFQGSFSYLKAGLWKVG